MNKSTSYAPEIRERAVRLLFEKYRRERDLPMLVFRFGLSALRTLADPNNPT